MESMRTLDSSLPGSSPHARRKQANSELLQAFKSAALSVTQLYKTANAEEEEANREAHFGGYSEALSDLLAFLDDQNLGLGDGEGWQVREWATQRHQSLNSHSRTSEDSGMSDDQETRGRSASPVLPQKSSSQQYQSAAVQTDPPNSTPSDGYPLQSKLTSQQSYSTETFHFRSPHALPTQQDTNLNTSAQRSPPSLRLELLPRTARYNAHRSVHHTRASEKTVGALGHGAGSKRKVPLHEFFDVTGLVGSKDVPGPGKRGRFS
ncbi:MAG: hypothetical protein Q9162_005932 [Coniocarpon cinnabarinum]